MYYECVLRSLNIFLGEIILDMLGMPSIENQINTNNTESIETTKNFPEYSYHGLWLPINNKFKR